MLARLTQGMLVSIIVAILVEIIDIVLSVLVGVLASYYGEWIDQFLARFTDMMFTFPGLQFVILLDDIFGYRQIKPLITSRLLAKMGARLLLVSLALSATAWPLMARYM